MAPLLSVTLSSKTRVVTTFGAIYQFRRGRPRHQAETKRTGHYGSWLTNLTNLFACLSSPFAS